jgi:hypothetical protein
MHYDTQREQHNEGVRKRRREGLLKQLDKAVSEMGNEDLDKLVIAAEDWDHVVAVINTIRAMGKN